MLSIMSKNYYQLTENPLYLVENVLERKRINGVMHAHVKWLGYPTYYNSWVPNGNLINIHR